MTHIDWRALHTAKEFYIWHDVKFWAEIGSLVSVLTCSFPIKWFTDLLTDWLKSVSDNNLDDICFAYEFRSQRNSALVSSWWFLVELLRVRFRVLVPASAEGSWWTRNYCLLQCINWPEPEIYSGLKGNRILLANMEKAVLYIIRL